MLQEIYIWNSATWTLSRKWTRPRAFQGRKLSAGRCACAGTARLEDASTTVLEVHSLATVPTVSVILKFKEFRFNFKLMFVVWC
jgi:hypothetical protein